ncbi:MAG: hypothetical protein QXD43_04955 [Candidatus Aenigmatarchaeota archaeon]
MKFSVPQYITIEDRIAGLTFTQLFLLVGAVIIIFIVSKLLPTILTVFIGGLLVICVIALGWVKINNKYLIVFLPNLIKFFLTKRIYTWKEIVKITTKKINIPTLEKYIKFLEQEETKEEKEETEIKQPLTKYIQYAHKHGYNPEDPYINFPLPKFPKRRW